ncbi:MAG: nucleotidyltransferase family protein [Acidobacteria bacterium]|nr:nucleotidyltransferase family protein [Acidobacteriota bacterium]
MMVIDPLREELRKLARALEPHGIRLIVGGGYGLLLRAEQIRSSGARTRFAELPVARSTNDIDIFLGAEVITDVAKTALIRAALDALGYEPIEGVRYYQFVLPVAYAGLPRGVKIDLLAAPVSGDREATVRQDSRRVRPREGGGLHAHTTPEALTVEDHAQPVDVGGDEPAVVYLPHPFSYLLLKLFALRDLLDDEAKGRGTHHAFDIYRTVAMMTSGEWQEALQMRERYAATDPVAEAGVLVEELFSGLEAPGMVRLREHARRVGEEIPPENLRSMIDDLHELLPAQREDAGAGLR